MTLLLPASLAANLFTTNFVVSCYRFCHTAAVDAPLDFFPMETKQQKFERKWDAGDIGCGRFIVALQREVLRLAPGEIIELTSRNEGTALDLPAWCRMTGNRLISASHPNYVLQRKDD